MALLDQGSYGAQLSSAATFTGIIRTIPVPLTAITIDGTSATLDSTDTSAPNAGALQITLANSDNTAMIAVMLPDDYDERSYDTDDLYPGDTLKLRVLAKATTTTTNTLAIDDIVYTRDGDAALTDPTLSTAQSTAQTVSASAYDIYEFDLSGLGLRACDAVTVTLGTTIAGDNILVRGVSLVYRGHIITTDNTRR